MFDKLFIRASIMFLLYMLFVAAISHWTDSSLEWALSEWKGRPVEVHGGLSFLMTLLFCPLVLMFNLIISIMQSA